MKKRESSMGRLANQLRSFMILLTQNWKLTNFPIFELSSLVSRYRDYPSAFLVTLHKVLRLKI